MRDRVDLPQKPFLYTLDQVAHLLDLRVDTLQLHYIHFDGRSIGVQPRDKLLAHNIAPTGVKPNWRIAEKELIRWMKNRGIRHYDSGW